MQWNTSNIAFCNHLTSRGLLGHIHLFRRRSFGKRKICATFIGSFEIRNGASGLSVLYGDSNNAVVLVYLGNTFGDEVLGESQVVS